MRILFLTNFYPPHELGGQGQSCQQIVDGLQRRGHQVCVLTSMHGTNNVPMVQENVHRQLYLEMDLVPWRQSITFFTQRKAREQQNIQRFQQIAAQFRPDIIFIWGMWNVPRSLPAHIEAHYPNKVAYRFADYWPTLPSQHELYWRAPGKSRLARLPKLCLRTLALAMLAQEGPPPALQFDHTMVVSASTRDILVRSGIPVAHARVIHTGIDTTSYLNANPDPSLCADESMLHLLYAGRLAADKGVDITIAAMAKLVSEYNLRNVRLNIAGAGSAEYEEKLRRLVNQNRLQEHVRFLGYIPRVEMPTVLHSNDVLLVPSTWQEPFARIVLEGMSAGLAVVATPTGGTKEIIIHRKNGLLFQPNDADDLSHQLLLLLNDAELRCAIAQAGQRLVVEHYTFDRMMNEIEQFLQDVNCSAHDAPVEPVMQNGTTL